MEFEEPEKPAKKVKLCGKSKEGSAVRVKKEGTLSVTINSEKPFSKFVEVGRVAYISFGKDAGKVCTIVDVIDQNRALIDGPCTKVQRQAISFKQLHLTKFRIKFPHTAKSAAVRKAWTKAKVTEAWKKTSWAKRLTLAKLRARLTDFDRFKLMKAKQARNRIVKREMVHLKKQAKKTGVAVVKTRKTRHAKKCLSLKKKRIAKKAIKK